MSTSQSPSRRDLLRLAGVAATAPLWPSVTVVAEAAAAADPSTAKKTSTLKLGLASYSLRKFPLDRVLEFCKAENIRYINLKDFHLARTDPPETTRALREKIQAAGLTIVGGGTITWKVNDEAEIRKDFEYAKNGGFPLIVASPNPDTLDTVEKLAVEYDIKVAIHNHGPEDQWYPAPADVLKRVDKRDARMGLCMDIGHTTRAGADPVKSVAEAGKRLLDLHMKDLADKTQRESQVEVGKGLLDIAGLFRALNKAKYTGHVGLEYEINENDPFVGIKESFAYMRGVADTLA